MSVATATPPAKTTGRKGSRDLELREFQAAGGSASVDRENHVVRNVKILGLTSANGRAYTESAIRNAVSMYEGKAVNVDHPPAGKENHARSYADRFGHLEHVQAKSDGLYGDLSYNPKHQVAEQFVHDAEHAPQRVGLSHNARARTSSRNGKLVVESILSVKSVDVVADPATTSSLFEHTEPNGDSDMMFTLADVKADTSIMESIRQEILTEVKGSADAKAKEAQLTESQQEVKTLKEQLDKLEAEKKAVERKAKVDEMLTEAKLPDEFVTDVFRDQLTEADDETAAKLIEDRKAMLKHTRRRGPQSKSQQVTEGTLPQGENAVQRSARWKTAC